MKLSEKILSLRKQHGISQEELAEKLNVSRQAISRWEVGSAQPDASNVLHLSKLFGVTTDYLLNDDYESDHDVPVVKYTEIAVKKKFKKIIALCLAGFGLFGNFIIYLLSRFIEVMVPVIKRDGGRTTYTWRSDITDYSYKYFLQEHNLEFLTAIFWILIIGGLFVAFVPKDKLNKVLASIKNKRQQKED